MINLDTFLNIIFIINIFLALIVVFIERKEPQAAWSWLVVLIFFPLGGFILYIFLGQNLHRAHLFTHTLLEQSLINKFIATQNKKISDEENYIKNKKMRRFKDLIALNINLNRAILTQDNAVEIFTDGHDKFESLLNDIKNAKHHIHMQYYILRPDRLGKQVLRELTSAVKRGVEVRLLYDAMGGRTMLKRHFHKFTAAGGKVSVFFPSKLHLINIRINYRNHRKIAIFDGETAYVGGFNIGREYLGKSRRFGYWRDTHLRIRGNGILGLQERFLIDWRHASNEQVLTLTDSPYFKNLEPAGNTAIQIVNCGPDEKEEHIKYMLMKMIQKAHEFIYIQTPYFVPDAALFESLKIAAMSGIDIRIMIPNRPDHLFVYWATYSYIGELIKYGVKCFIYEDGFLHAKTMVVDGLVASVGSANYDVRSFKLNFETNAAIFDEKIAEKLKNIFLCDLEKCSILDIQRYNKRGTFIKLKEAVSRLLSPIL